MTLRNLRIFCALAETGSATDAAEKLFISQPSVSVALRELENYYGVRLFERLGRRLVITPEGERFYSYAVHITKLFEELELGMKQPGDELPLRAGASITVGTRYMPRVIRSYGSEVRLSLRRRTRLKKVFWTVRWIADYRGCAAQPADCRRKAVRRRYCAGLRALTSVCVRIKSWRRQSLCSSLSFA